MSVIGALRHWRELTRQHEEPSYSLRQLTAYFLKLGTIGFGGPVALVGYMRRDLVEARKWITDEDYDVGLALAQLSPGPLAAQLGFYIGFVHYGVLGATLVGIAFVLPSFVMVVALGWAYSRYGGLQSIQSIFLHGRCRGHRHHRQQRIRADQKRRSGGTLCCGRSFWSSLRSRSSPNQKSFGCSSEPACWCGW